MKQFLTGFLCGAVVALLVAAGGALFVTESPVPFMSKVQSSATEYVQDALKGRSSDPNERPERLPSPLPLRLRPPRLPPRPLPRAARLRMIRPPISSSRTTTRLLPRRFSPRRLTSLFSSAPTRRLTRLKQLEPKLRSPDLIPVFLTAMMDVIASVLDPSTLKGMPARHRARSAPMTFLARSFTDF